jgi:hypothetical protein
MTARKRKKPAKATGTGSAAPKKKAVDPYAMMSAVPATWELSGWPKDVWPHTPSRGRRLVLAHRDSLIAALALSRPEKNIVVIGSSFMRWLVSHRDKVRDFDIAPNVQGDQE